MVEINYIMCHKLFGSFWSRGLIRLLSLHLDRVVRLLRRQLIRLISKPKEGFRFCFKRHSMLVLHVVVGTDCLLYFEMVYILRPHILQLLRFYKLVEIFFITPR